MHHYLCQQQQLVFTQSANTSLKTRELADKAAALAGEVKKRQKTVCTRENDARSSG
jgi:hypothetical protein